MVFVSFITGFFFMDSQRFIADDLGLAKIQSGVAGPATFFRQAIKDRQKKLERVTSLDLDEAWPWGIKDMGN